LPEVNLLQYQSINNKYSLASSLLATLEQMKEGRCFLSSKEIAGQKMYREVALRHGLRPTLKRKSLFLFFIAQ